MDDEELDLPRLSCKDCVYFRNCKRLSGHKIRVYAPYFLCDPQENHIPCRDFEMKHPEYNANKNFVSIDKYLQDFEDYKDHQKYCSFFINGDNTKSYQVEFDKFYNGTMFDGNKLLAYQVTYYKTQDHRHGLVYEKIDGVMVEESE